MTDTIHFQNPDDGASMTLVKRTSRTRATQLEVVTGDDGTESTLADAHEMTIQIREREITDIVEAAKYLKRTFGIDY